MVSPSTKKRIWDGLSVIGALTVITVVGGVVVAVAAAAYTGNKYGRTTYQYVYPRQKFYRNYT